jgi:hypothetical protein
MVPIKQLLLDLDAHVENEEKNLANNIIQDLMTYMQKGYSQAERISTELDKRFRQLSVAEVFFDCCNYNVCAKALNLKPAKAFFSGCRFHHRYCRASEQVRLEYDALHPPIRLNQLICSGQNRKGEMYCLISMCRIFDRSGIGWYPFLCS